MYLLTATDPKLPDASVNDRAYAEYARQFADLEKERDAFELQAAPVIARLAGLPSWGDVRSISFYSTKVDLYLAADKKDSALPREIAIEFEVKGEKHPDSDSLYVNFDLGAVRLDVNGYIPKTCKLVEVEEYIPGEVRKVKRVVCTEESA